MKRLILSVLSIVFVGGAIFALPQEAFAQKVQAVEGITVEAVDYSDSSHWLALPKKASKNVDIFFVYPTSWRSLDGYPVADL
ncbi:MAG: hypothetical protein LBB93_04395, partial [Elusimicrobiota bacterium]|nr:hypothetical protein [Elusimicrobiota bacterium]